MDIARMFGMGAVLQMAPTPTQIQDYATAFDAFRSRPSATAVAEPGAQTREQEFPPAPEPATVEVTPADVDRGVLAQHAQLAARLGVHSDADKELRTAEFESFLRESGLRVYDEKQVGAYLTSQYGVEKKEQGRKIPTWGWRPLRAKDGREQPIDEDQARWMMMARGLMASSEANGEIHRDATTYRKPVPIPVLLTVERVVEKFPDAKLYVSDEFHPREFVKDPFLMVVHQGKRYIIERWDEPNYKER